MTPQEIKLDVRDLEPPEPYERVTEALRSIAAGQYIRMISRRRPLLLYPWLQEHGFAELTRELGEEHYELFIWPDADGETAAYIAGSC